MSEEESTELARRLLEQYAMSGQADRAASLAGTGEGNPLFIEELAASLAERSTQDADALPTSIRGIVGARLDALPPAERAVLLDAAVVGKVFWRGAVARLRSGSDDLSDVLGSLERRDLIRREAVSRIRGDHQFSFKHVLIMDVAYQTLPRAERRSRHAVIAEFLEEAMPELGDAAAPLAHHWREAGQLDRARDNLVAAAEQAGRGWAKERAVKLYQEALEIVPKSDPDLRRDILRRLAVATQATMHQFDVEQQRARSPESDGTS